MLWRFLREVARHDDAWAAEIVDRLTALCGQELQALWKVRLTGRTAPGLREHLDAGRVRLGRLLNEPVDRDERPRAVALTGRRLASGWLWRRFTA